MLLHSDHGKNLRLGYKTLILKYEVVYQRIQTRNVDCAAKCELYSFKKKIKYLTSIYSKVTHKKEIWVVLLTLLIRHWKSKLNTARNSKINSEYYKDFHIKSQVLFVPGKHCFHEDLILRSFIFHCLRKEFLQLEKQLNMNSDSRINNQELRWRVFFNSKVYQFVL